MEQHTKIIDLYGLPGCGKTTLQNSFISLCKDQSFSVGYLPDLTTYMRKHPISSFVKSFSISQFFLLFRFFCSVPLLRLSDWSIYWGFIKFLFIYKFSKTVQIKDFIIVDHGFCQSVGSLTYGNIEYLSENSRHLLYRLFTVIDIDIPIYCHISAELSLYRIRYRNRQSKSGRLDLINDDAKLMNALKIQAIMFDSIYSLTKTNLNSQFIEMNDEVESIAIQVLNSISCYSSINEVH